ncbi:AraC family transcriptional regulator [Massilia sp. TN1-12]|uniref:AraC family transcriptional regulator n=1 Tax=Massilia paldalensis TaxID=3377675 RepID=UPI00384FC86A
MDTHDRPAGNAARFSPLAGGITLMQASFSDHAFERHSHDCFSIGVTTYGIQQFRCRGRVHDSRPGDLVLFNPDEDHDGSRGRSDGFGYAIWYVPEAFVRDCLDPDAGLHGKPYFAAPHATDRRLATAFTMLTSTLLESPSDTLRAESLLGAFLANTLARHGERPQVLPAPPRDPGAAALLRVKDYIRAHFQRDLTIAELAGVAGLSRAHFTRAFGAAFHVAPHVYLNAVRIHHAQALIRRGMPLADVALECGYADQSHFNRRFKGSVGVAPSAWRSMAGRSTGGSTAV